MDKARGDGWAELCPNRVLKGQVGFHGGDHGGNEANFTARPWKSASTAYQSRSRDPSSFGYRKGRKTADALTKIWREIQAGNEWIVDADLKDYFGSVDHDKLLTLVGKHDL
jgi:hypothetical protein